MRQKLYVLTKVNEEGYVNNNVTVSSNIENIMDTLKQKIREQYATNNNTRNAMIQNITNTNNNDIIQTLEENNYVAMSGPDNVQFEINVYTGPLNGDNPTIIANNRATNSTNNRTNQNNNGPRPLNAPMVNIPMPSFPSFENMQENVQEDPTMGPIGGRRRRFGKKSRKGRKKAKAKVNAKKTRRRA